ncbi:MAG: D-2-hydroxyacid dehydrogenase [Spirochaetes bacterium]|nr:D-2-hydroxyacid dehydrogenase [Spirochaetota bacterium]
MKIVILDGYTTNPGDLSWDALAALGALTVHERTPRESIIERAKDAELVITNKTLLDRAIIEQLPKLRYVGLLSTGTNAADGAALAKRNIPLCNVPAYSTMSVAQQVFVLLLELVNRAGHHSQTVHDGAWASSKDFCYWNYPLVELAGLTMGIAGFGAIGQAVARIAHAFGMNIIVYNRSRKPSDIPVRFVDIQTLAAESDVISLHCPLTDETKGIVNAAFIARMKRTAYLINTGRGPLIEESALAEALNTERIAGAGLDVLSTEPPARDNPLIGAKNCIITPHIAWATKAARSRLIGVVAANVRGFLSGSPQNIVNGVAARQDS